MNDLSWLIYWADVLPGVRQSIGFIGFIAATGSLLIGAYRFFTRAIEEKEPEGGANWKWVLCACIFMLSIIQFIPSRDTFYAIAASEIGEDVLKSPTASKALKALDQWLDKQIEGDKSDAPAK